MIPKVLDNLSETSLLWIIGGLSTIALWVTRNILTNGKRIALLEQQNEFHYKLRKADHETIKDLHVGINDIRNHLLK